MFLHYLHTYPRAVPPMSPEQAPLTVCKPVLAAISYREGAASCRIQLFRTEDKEEVKVPSSGETASFPF
jgi:hypothetical protein